MLQAACGLYHTCALVEVPEWTQLGTTKGGVEGLQRKPPSARHNSNRNPNPKVHPEMQLCIPTLTLTSLTLTLSPETLSPLQAWAHSILYQGGFMSCPIPPPGLGPLFPISGGGLCHVLSPLQAWAHSILC